jgi:hypothetical protein
MAPEQSFSKRHGFSQAKDITIREDAPENLRSFVLQTARSLGLGVHLQRQVLCRALRVPYSEELGRRRREEIEVEELMMNSCPWFKVYDIIEAFFASLAHYDEYSGEDHARAFADEINEFFLDEGIGWQMVGGQVVTRGTESFEAVVTAAISALEASERPTAAKHLHEALQDLTATAGGFTRRCLSRIGIARMRGS